MTYYYIFHRSNSLIFPLEFFINISITMYLFLYYFLNNEIYRLFYNSFIQLYRLKSLVRYINKIY